MIAKRGAAIMKNRVRTTAVPVSLDPNLMALQVLPGMRPDLGLTQPGEYGLFTILRAHAPAADEAYAADCARRMVAHLRQNQLLAPGWSNSIGGRMRVEQSLLAESWNPIYQGLGFDRDAEAPPLLKPAVNELGKADGAS